jgi:hypothetical protein
VVNTVEAPDTINDFCGLPAELCRLRYDARGTVLHSSWYWGDLAMMLMGLTLIDLDAPAGKPSFFK